MTANPSINLKESLSSKLFRVLISVCLLSLTILTTRAQDSSSGMEVPSRPLNHILDDSRFFNVDEREQIQQEMSRRFIEQQVDVYLVVLDAKPAQGSKAFARAAGEKWSRAPVWCVILCVLGDPDGILVEAGGIEIPQPSIDFAVAESVKRARRESGVKAQLLAASQECSNDLRFLLATHNLASERQVKRNDVAIGAKTRKAKILKLLAIVAGILLIIGTAVIFLVVRKIKSRRRNFTFPETVWRERFLGPFSGGGGVVVSYRK